MQTIYKFISELLQVLKQGNMPATHTVNTMSNCSEETPHDFYCDAEKPFVSF